MPLCSPIMTTLLSQVSHHDCHQDITHPEQIPDHPRAAKCLKMVSEEDGLLLIGGGVLFLAAAKLPDAGKLFALSPDADARGSVT